MAVLTPRKSPSINLIWDCFGPRVSLTFAQERTCWFFRQLVPFFCCCISNTPVAVPNNRMEVGSFKHMSLISGQLNPMEQSPWQANSQPTKTFHAVYGTRTFGTIIRSTRNWSTSWNPNVFDPNRRKRSDPPHLLIYALVSQCLLPFRSPSIILHTVLNYLVLYTWKWPSQNTFGMWTVLY